VNRRQGRKEHRCINTPQRKKAAASRSALPALRFPSVQSFPA
jgi:hypothetical protein